MTDKTTIPAPNYTQIPNVFLDEVLPKITSMSELKVTLAIMRQTFGYHKKHDRISLSQLETFTGLSRSSVMDGINAGIERGTIERRKAGLSYFYRVQVVANYYQSEITTGSKVLPEVVAKYYQSDGSGSSKVLPTKESTTITTVLLKESTKESTADAASATPKKAEKSKTKAAAKSAAYVAGSIVALDDEFHILLRRFCKATSAATDAKQQAVELAAKALLESGATVAQLETVIGNYWRHKPTTNAYYKKSPTADEVRDGFTDWLEISERTTQEPDSAPKKTEREKRFDAAMNLQRGEGLPAILGGVE